MNFQFSEVHIWSAGTQPLVEALWLNNTNKQWELILQGLSVPSWKMNFVPDFRGFCVSLV